jgi:hypothetical protein
MELTPEELTEIDRQARAYGFEIGRGQPLAEQVNANDSNPFLDKDWRESVTDEPDLDITLPLLAKESKKVSVVVWARNPHCSNCGDTRGGPIGHEASECTWAPEFVDVQITYNGKTMPGRARRSDLTNALAWEGRLGD